MRAPTLTAQAKKKSRNPSKRAKQPPLRKQLYLTLTLIVTVILPKTNLNSSPKRRLLRAPTLTLQSLKSLHPRKLLPRKQPQRKPQALTPIATLQNPKSPLPRRLLLPRKLPQRKLTAPHLMTVMTLQNLKSPLPRRRPRKPKVPTLMTPTRPHLKKKKRPLLDLELTQRSLPKRSLLPLLMFPQRMQVKLNFSLDVSL